jgi:hypothetical protein
MPGILIPMHSEKFIPASRGVGFSLLVIPSEAVIRVFHEFACRPDTGFRRYDDHSNRHSVSRMENDDMLGDFDAPTKAYMSVRRSANEGSAFIWKWNYSTRSNWRSITFVSVGPVMKRPPACRREVVRVVAVEIALGSMRRCAPAWRCRRPRMPPRRPSARRCRPCPPRGGSRPCPFRLQREGKGKLHVATP